MAEKKNLCAPIPEELHRQVREEQERLGQTLGQYVEQVLREHFEGRRERDMSSKNRTMAFQVSEEFFLRIKAYLAAHDGLSQREFVVGLVEAALEEWEAGNTETEDSES